MSLTAALADILERHVGDRGAAGIAVATPDTTEPVLAWLPRSAAREPVYLAYSITKTFIAVLVLQLRDEGA
jgi:D-alanyl-D-alanine carboxypeptidase